MTRLNARMVDVITISKPSTTTAPADHPSTRHITVTFGDGRIGLLDNTSHRSRVWAEVLESQRENGQPAYVEIDVETNTITEVLLPVQNVVVRISPARDGLEVTLMISHARHLLRRANPRFESLRKTLADAQKKARPVWVVENDDHDIVDVNPIPEEPRPRRARGGSR